MRQRPGGGRLRGRPVLAAPYVAAFGALNAYLWKRTGKDRIPVIVYSAALLAMSLTALDSGWPATAVGGALFLVSDALLALEKFGGLHVPAHEGLVMATYTSARHCWPGNGGTCGRRRHDRLGRSFEQRSFGSGKALEPGVEGLIGGAECGEERSPVLLVLPAVDGPEPAGPGSIAVQLGAQESRCLAKQLAPGAVGGVGRGERLCPVAGHLVLPHPHEHASIRPQPQPRAHPNGPVFAVPGWQRLAGSAETPSALICAYG